ncbi:hypothetical protein NDU88_000089 [Pleurodeles waltl]|uniref:Uncharacterized protein n=1 Tax=Pleurodeles waltl TaxID=8319 RepID=A0AAV7MIP6_PLEWA|nr:hypothetical protein NDU88_000089 [Pleurodeles waltl]
MIESCVRPAERGNEQTILHPVKPRDTKHEYNTHVYPLVSTLLSNWGLKYSNLHMHVRRNGSAVNISTSPMGTRARLGSEEPEKTLVLWTGSMMLITNQTSLRYLLASRQKKENKHNTYAASSFPGLAAALFDIETDAQQTLRWQQVKKQISIIIFSIQSAASVLRDTSDIGGL